MFEVSRAWVHRLIQRRRETGSLEPRKQTRFRHRALAPDQERRLADLIAVQPDATLVELWEALPTSAALSTLWRTIDRLQLTLKKEPYTPTNSTGPTSPLKVGAGASGCPCGMCGNTSSSMSAA